MGFDGKKSWHEIHYHYQQTSRRICHVRLESERLQCGKTDSLWQGYHQVAEGRMR